MNEERCKRLEERQATLEQRVGAAIDVAIATLRDEIGVEDALDRLAALRSPGVGAASESDRCRQAAQRLVEIVGADGPMSLEDVIEWAGGKVDAAEFALATARRERDEAVAIVRDWLVWRSVHHVSDVHFPDLASVLSRARALVAAEEGPGPNAAGIAAALSTWQAERLANEALAGGPPPHDCGDGLVNDEPGATTWRGLVDAKEAEIADLRERCAFREQERDEARARIAALKAERTKLLKEQHAEEQKLRARIAELEAREVAANHRALGLQYELDTVVAALQERDRESRWIIEHIPMMQGSPTFEARVAEYLSATPPADPARGLVERAMSAMLVLAPHSPLIAHLRAYLGGGT